MKGNAIVHNYGTQAQEFLLHQARSLDLKFQVVVMDNLSSHKVTGAGLLYLPPYSPDFKPIGYTCGRDGTNDLRSWSKPEGMRFASAVSIWSRIVEEDCMVNLFRLMFALSAQRVKRLSLDLKH